MLAITNSIEHNANTEATTPDIPRATRSPTAGPECRGYRVTAPELVAPAAVASYQSWSERLGLRVFGVGNILRLHRLDGEN
ncbi:hypothetical protein [Nocardia acidivorans]|uniref:hypothetical protein n=1 Tax=Nocardia acidivorans TaxID=404580 RepID=UPI000833B860|nr:hypothetical protein [Nocardia acidivorans]